MWRRRWEAVARSQNYVGTEHLLLGLLRQADSTASKAIAGLGIHLEQIQQAASVRPEAGPQPGSAQIGLSPRAKRVVELAVDRTRQIRRPYTGTEHILLGLVLEEGGMTGGSCAHSGSR